MIKKVFPVLAGAIMITFNLSAQELTRFNQDIVELIDEFERKQHMNGLMSEESYDGSPYLDADFVEGEILSLDGKVFKSVPLRYNIYNDLFEFKSEKGILALEKSERFAQFNFGNRTFVYSKYSDGKREMEGYLELIERGAYSAYARYRITLKPAEKPAPYKEARKATFTTPGEDYLVSGPGILPAFVSSSSELSKLFPSLAEKIEKFEGGKKKKLRKREDIVGLINYLNSN